MTPDPAARPTQLIWATRGRLWGFRFLLDAGFEDPLPVYERAFAELSDEPSACRREGCAAALRFPDPVGRRDAAGRLIPHEFVVIGDLADAISSVSEGMKEIWPLVSRVYARIWDMEEAPTAVDMRFEG